MNRFFKSKLMRGALICSVTIIFLLSGPFSTVAADEASNLDGIYTESRTSIDEKGMEREFFPFDYVVLELQGNQFKYWHFSDCLGPSIYPISGKYSREGEIIELDHEKLRPSEKRFVATTIKGVSGIWPEEKLKSWKKGNYPKRVPILVRVADGPSGKEGPDLSKFKFPSVTPLLDKEAAKSFWLKQAKKHAQRYNELPEPLRSLLRERSRRDDPNLDGYRNLVLKQQENPDPVLITQLVAGAGKGKLTVIGPIVLEDIYGPGIFFPDKPEFEKQDSTKLAALKVLVDAMTVAENERALTKTLFLFLRISGVQEIDLVCDNGTRVKLKQKGNQKTMQSYSFSEIVKNNVQNWANKQLAELFGE